MEIYTSRKLNTLLSLAFLWGLSGVLSQIQTPQENMEVIQGQRVVLQAGYTPTPGVDLSQSTVLWNFMANTTKLIIAYTKTTVYPEDSPFLGRVDFAVAMPSSVVSLYINNTQESDSGRYLCQVIRSGAPPLTWELTLNVKVPPAVPVCSLSGKPVLKGNVTLNCHSKSGKPIPVYKWKKTSPVSEVFFSPMLNEKTGTLKLNNLSGNMSGKFVCSASNTAGSESCYINLEVITWRTPKRPNEFRGPRAAQARTLSPRTALCPPLPPVPTRGTQLTTTTITITTTITTCSSTHNDLPPTPPPSSPPRAAWLATGLASMAPPPQTKATSTTAASLRPAASPQTPRRRGPTAVPFPGQNVPLPSPRPSPFPRPTASLQLHARHCCRPRW
ncbi:endothelial cell adhesion molecule a isoform 2-T2 [Aplochiton taeniatus]